MTPDRRTLLTLFAFAFGVRVLYAVVMGDNPDVISIHETYDFRVAARMLDGWAWLTTPFSPLAPGYLIALAMVFRLAGVSWWSAVMFNVVLGATTTLFLYRIGERRLGPRVGFASALWLGATVNQIHYASLAVRDVMTTFLLVWLAYALVTPFRRMRSAVWVGFLYLLLVYTEPMFLLLLPVFIVFLGLRATQHRTLSLQYMFLFIATVCMLSIPWTVRNYIVYHEFVPVSLKASRYTSMLWARAEAAPLPAEGIPPVEVPGFVDNTREYWRFARFTEAPGDPGLGIRPEPAWSFRHNAASILNFGILLPFFVAGMGFAVAKRRRAVLILSGIVVCHAVLRGFLGGTNEARLPAEPLIILVAFYGLHELLAARRAAGEPRHAEAAEG